MRIGSRLSTKPARAVAPATSTMAIHLQFRLHHSQAQIRRVPALLAQEKPEDGETPKPWNVQVARRRGSPRAGGPVLQAALKPGLQFIDLASSATHFSREAAKFAKKGIANIKPSRLRVFA
jgi:hypothetical protein